MHLGARGFVHPELIDPGTEAPIALTDGATGELVLTHLRHQAAPLLRFRTRDHVRVRTTPCPCGRDSLRIRCIGRTDDMLLVRGVNVFPSAIREVVAGFAPRTTGHILVRPAIPGPKQDPPLPLDVESDRPDDVDLQHEIEAKLRAVLVVGTRVTLVAAGTLQRSQYKSRLVAVD
jgi:phenylacetate-CoA ligase